MITITGKDLNDIRCQLGLNDYKPTHWICIQARIEDYGRIILPGCIIHESSKIPLEFTEMSEALNHLKGLLCKLDGAKGQDTETGPLS